MNLLNAMLAQELCRWKSMIKALTLVISVSDFSREKIGEMGFSKNDKYSNLVWIYIISAFVIRHVGFQL